MGTLIGYSVILIGRELDADAEVTTIEIHADEAKAAEKDILRVGISPRVNVIEGDAIKIIPTTKECFDVVFVDAEKNEYLQYLKLMEDKLHKGTVIIADDAGIFGDQMRDYLFVQKSGGNRSRYVQIGENGVEIRIRV